MLAVTFSAVLIALQCGLLLGLFKITSIPIDNTHGRPLGRFHRGAERGPRQADPDLVPHAASRASPGVDMPELYIANFANFTKPVGGTELCFLLGSELDDDAAGAADRAHHASSATP